MNFKDLKLLLLIIRFRTVAMFNALKDKGIVEAIPDYDYNIDFDQYDAKAFDKYLKAFDLAKDRVNSLIDEVNLNGFYDKNGDEIQNIFFPDVDQVNSDMVKYQYQGAYELLNDQLNKIEEVLTQAKIMKEVTDGN